MRLTRPTTGKRRQSCLASGVDTNGKSAQAALAEFQRHGFYLTHVLECPLEDSANPSELLSNRLPSLFTRVRRSLKPKRLIPISVDLAPFVDRIKGAKLECEVVLDSGRPFALDSAESRTRLREALAVPTSALRPLTWPLSVL